MHYLDHKIEKLERPERIAELNPTETLRRIGITSQDVLCDLGSGSGIFTLAAAQLTDESIYAIDSNEQLMDYLKKRLPEEVAQRVQCIVPKEYSYPIVSRQIDLLLLVTVYHEIDQRPLLLAEIKRILKRTGRVAVIEFHYQETPMGPPLDHRIDAAQVIADFKAENFQLIERFDIGNNFYCLIFTSDQV